MSVEWFLKLKEIDSLGKMRINYLKIVEEQQARISKLLERKDASIAQTATLNHDQRTLQQSLFDLEKKLQLYSKQKENLSSLGGEEKKIESIGLEIEKLENDGLTLLDQSETIQQEINDCKTFQAGLDKTIQEISSEVGVDLKHHEEEIERINFRLKLLEDELPNNFQQVFRRTLLKKLAHGPFTRIEAGSCYFCRHKISRQDEIEIDLQQDLKTCNQCGRIFLPYGS